MALIQEKIHTIDDIHSLPEGKRAELIDGQIYYMTPPTRNHQRISGEIFALIRKYIHTNGGSFEVDIAPYAVFLNENGANYTEPDISVICDPGRLNDKGCTGAPDQIIEIVSPSSRRMDYFIILFKYRTAGVRECWIVDTDRDRITVYDFESEDTKDYTFSDSVKSCIYDGLCINFSDIAKLLNI